MRHSSFVSLAAAAAMLVLGQASPAGASTGHRISGPVVHENLAIYFVHGPSAGGPVPLTLAEALAKGVVRVIETGNVNQLDIQNTGDETVFVQAGDIVKGGKQDRVLTVSLSLPAHSGLIPIASFCVERGRWNARGREDVARFASAASSLPSRDAKLAMRAPNMPASPNPAPHNMLGQLPIAGVQTNQLEMWKSVDRIQQRLSGSLGAPVTATQSQSSLQLSLEHEKLKEAQDKYLKALQAAGEKDADIVGYVFAINGKLNSAEIYPSNGLFRKMWPKLLIASVTEAIGEKDTVAETPPMGEAVTAFLDAAEQGKKNEKDIAGTVQLETRESGAGYYFETRSPAGDWLHRSYLAK